MECFHMPKICILSTNSDGHYFGSSQITQQRKEQKCGHCDNCLRQPDAVVRRTSRNTLTTFAGSWTLSNPVLRRQERKFTLLKLVEVWRGMGSESKCIAGCAGSRTPERALDNADGTHRDCLRLNGMLEEDIHFTSYSTIAYLRCTQRGARFIRLYGPIPTTLNASS